MKVWVWALRVAPWAIRVVGVVAVVVGSAIWGARNEYSPETLLQRQLATTLVPVDTSTVTDLTATCNAVNQDEGWVLFVVSAQLVSDAQARRYLQTADEPFGLFIEYDPALLRLGLGLGPEKWNTELPIRYVRRDEFAVITMGVSRSQTRVVTNLGDQQTVWPNGFAPQWRCDGVELGRANHTFASGATCQNLRAPCNTGCVTTNCCHSALQSCIVAMGLASIPIAIPVVPKYNGLLRLRLTAHLACCKLTARVIALTVRPAWVCKAKSSAACCCVNTRAAAEPTRVKPATISTIATPTCRQNRLCVYLALPETALMFTALNKGIKTTIKNCGVKKGTFKIEVKFTEYTVPIVCVNYRRNKRLYGGGQIEAPMT